MTTIDQHTDLFRMPALGADMTEGRVVEWYVAQGARAERGDLVAVIETDKSDIEIEVFEPCVFEEFLVRIGETVPVGQPIARVLVDGPPDDSAPPTPPEPTESSASVTTPEASTPTRHRRDESTPRMTPRARRLARERGLDLRSLPSQGTITGDTIVRLADDPATSAPRADRTSNVRQAIARLMERSWAEIPHYHVTSSIDLTESMNRLDRYNAEQQVDERIVPAAMLYVAVARAVRDTPQLNGWWRDGAFVPSDSVDLGVILSLRTGGIVVPTIPAADQLDTSQMMQVVRDLVERARRGRLRERDMRPASISITNLGDLGAHGVLGVIHPPQVTLVGFGAPRLLPAIVDGDVTPRLMLEASIAGDHRAHDGLVASRLFRHLSRHLEDLP